MGELACTTARNLVYALQQERIDTYVQ